MFSQSISKSFFPMKLINLFSTFFLASSCIFFASCVQDDKDAEYNSYKQGAENQAQPSLLPPNEVASFENEIPVSLPKTGEEIVLVSATDASSKAKEVKPQLQQENTQPNVKFSAKEGKTPPPVAAVEKPKPIKEMPLSPKSESSKPESKRIVEVPVNKNIPTEVVSAAPITPKVMRGEPVGQTRGLTPNAENTIPASKGAVPVLTQDEYDFGTVTEGTKVTHRFTLSH
ncbi:MAG: hypothetical protein Q6K81_05310 [Gloeomargarita sp. DG02_5_bins_242]